MSEREWREQALTLADELERLRLEVLKVRLEGARPQTPASRQGLEGLHGELCAVWLALEERAPDLAPVLSRCIERLEDHLR